MSENTVNNPTNTSTFSDSLYRALLTTALLFLLDLVVTYLSYASGYLDGYFTHIMFVAQGAALAIIMAGGLAVFDRLGHAINRVLDRSRWMRKPNLGIGMQTALVTGCGLMLINNGDGRMIHLAPIHHNLMAVAPAGVCFVTAWLLARKEQVCARANTMALVSVFLSLWVLANYAGMILNGRFGLGTSNILRTKIVLMTVTATVLFFIVYAHRRKLSTGRIRTVASALLALGLLVSLHLVNATQQVDNYLEFHTCLTLFSIFIAWHLADTVIVPLFGRARLSARRGLLTYVVLLTAATGILVLNGSTASVRYVGAIHTVQQRFALEVIHGGVLRLFDFVPETICTIRNRFLKRGGYSFPIQSEGTLPSTFQPVVFDLSFDRPEVHNLVLFFLDTKRPGDIGLYDEEHSRTPRIDACFEQGFVFTNARVAANHTGTTFPTIYTSTFGATRHQDLSTMVELPYWYAYQSGNGLGHIFRRAGFLTVVLTNDWYNRELFSWPHQEPIFGGFDQMVVAIPGEGTDTERLLAAYEQGDGIIPDEGRFLVVVHVLEHSASRIEEVDEMVGRVCDEVRAEGRWDDTVVGKPQKPRISEQVG